MKIPFLKPSISEQDIKNAVKSIRSGWLKPSKFTEIFEKKFSDYLGAEGAVMCGSCTAALHMSLILAGVKEGDEVITTPMTYVATSNVILYQRAKPVFVDVDPRTGLIDLDKIEGKITDKTKAVIVVHLYGQMADMKKLKKIADKHNLKIIEDAAHSVESERDGVRPGQLSFAACFSFHAAKNLTSGQGGALVSNDKEVLEKAKILRRDGVVNIGNKRKMHMLGYKYDHADFQPALLLGQLDRIKKTHAKRLKVMERYVKKLSGLERVDYPAVGKDAVHSGHLFVVWVDPAKRDKIIYELEKAGVESSIHYEPVHLEPHYAKEFGFKRGDFPVAEKMGDSVISLPTYSSLTPREQDYIIKILKKFI